MLALVPLAFLLAASSPASGRNTTLDPRQYVSGSGEFALLINPSDRGGRGRATYQLTRAGTEVWARSLPYTFREADVSDDGSFAGFAYTNDIKGSMLLIAIVSPDGEVRAEHALDRKMWGPHGSDYPIGSDVFLRPTLDQCVVMLSLNPNRGGDVWHVYDMDSGAQIEAIDPLQLTDASGLSSPLFGTAIPGTSLTLVQWYVTDWPKTGTRFVTYDQHWAETWSLDLPGDYFAEDEVEHRKILHTVWENGAILDIHQRAFAVKSFRDAARLEFSVEPLPSGGGWSVTGPTSTALSDCPVLVQSELEPTPIETVNLSPSHPIEPGVAFIDLLGRILVQDTATGSVHVFDDAGRPLFVCDPDPSDFERVNLASCIAATPDGRVLVQGHALRKTLVEFGPDGQRWRDVDLGSGTVVFGPRSGAWWRIRPYGGLLELVNASGRVEATVDRHPDGTWLRSASPVAVAPDGSMAVVDQGGDRLERWHPMLSLYDPEARPVRSVLLPDDTRTFFLAYSARWIAMDARDGQALLVRTSDDSLHHMELAPADAEELWVPGFSPDGRELWWFEGLRLHKYALP